MSDEWPLEGFERELARRPRVVLLYHTRSAQGRALVPAFDAAGIESSVPFARVPLHGLRSLVAKRRQLRALPTVAYYERGEELERLEPVHGDPLDEHDLAGFVEAVEALQEQYRVRRGRLQLDRFG